jgi:hypothetical protein
MNAQALRDAGIEDRLVNVVVFAKKGHALAAQKLGITQAAVAFRVWRVAEQLREKGLVDLSTWVETPE